MPKNLVIVESPAKAKTIEGFLGKDYDVRSSFGHIRDLPKKGLNIDIKHRFKPKYEIISDKVKIVNELKKASVNKTVWLASDEDREGEAIAWHLVESLKLKPSQTKRIAFHEITKPAIEHALANPRKINAKLVDAQQARRILDRLVGYELSPVLWKKVRGGLSAGRVQSVAVRLIIDRENEIKKHEKETYFKVVGTFAAKSQFNADLSEKIKTHTKANNWLEGLVNAKFKVAEISEKPGTRNPSPPFTTSTLQQEASRRLSFSVRQTMTLAQRLYESGHITYMRTDSTTLSNQALTASEKYIKETYGDKYFKSRQFQTKTKGAQEAHEAIRPTHFHKTEVSKDNQIQRLYNLIWRRSIASQMTPAQTEKTEAKISISTKPEFFIASGEILKFDGFLKVYGGGKDDKILPKLEKGQTLELVEARATETQTRMPARYSEASLVKKLEELGIGRPSTYAPTISTIQSRGYVEKKDIVGEEHTFQELILKDKIIKNSELKLTIGSDKAKLTPTPVAELVIDFLVKYFASILDYDFTAKLENDFDNVANGEESWEKMIEDFYKHFHPLVVKTDKVSRSEVSQARLLGKDPVSKEPIYARFGRYGPMLVKGNIEDSEAEPVFAPLPENTTLDNVKLSEALEMFKLPKTVGFTKDGEEIKANIGRFGPYIQVGKLYVSIKPPLTIDNIKEAEARKLYQAKVTQEKEKHIQEFPGGIKVLNGPYGPYVTDGKKNAKISKDINPKKLTEKEALAILNTAPVKKFKQKVKQ